MELLAACAFGLEFVVKRELEQLGYEAKSNQPGRVSFQGDYQALVRSNLWLRSADRILIELAKFDSPDFDALFETCKQLPWAELLPADASFPVTGRSRKSQLTSVPAIQRTVKRAAVDGLLREHGVASLPETGGKYALDISILNDVATLTLDSTGPSLHKRGYRKLVGPAPIKETLAAAMVLLSVWNADRPLLDPFCGSGTIPIEAALIGLNMAPGLNRSFSCQQWPVIEREIWTNAIDEALSLKSDNQLQIVGTDKDAEVLSLARYHAEQAEVSEQIHFQQRAFSDLRSKREYGCVITNPPYGERLEEQDQLLGLYEEFPAVLQRLPTWSHFILTSMPLEKIIHKRANRRRKLFNGRIECQYFQFLGPRPPRLSDASRETVDVPADPVFEPETSASPSHVGVASELGNGEPSSELIDKPLNPPSSQPTSEETDKESQRTSEETDGKTQESHRVAVPIQAASPNAVGTPGSDSAEDLENTNTLSTATTPPKFGSRPKSVRRKVKEIKPVFGGLDDKAAHQADLFAARLRKRAKHLRRYPKRGVHCYRLYERDIPELPFVVDVYHDHLHITEYERPHDRDLGQHGAWLELMKKTAAKSLDVPIQNVHLKSRQRQKGSRQYQRVSDARQFIQVEEGGLTFLVNLEDYVDTGLFLDHRQTRQMVREDAQGKRFLNLFAYTGSFSVYAAAGGAFLTTTVDLSKNYLDWAQRNMRTNGFDSEKHGFEHADTRKFLEQAKKDKRVFDLVVVDPPTFSNSKQTDDDWEVQAGHTELLEQLHGVLAENAIVYFSTNFRRFKLDEESLAEQFRIIEITKQTIPEEFRNKRIHRCWKLFKR